MAQNPIHHSRGNLPLWIIAVSLLVIAVCLIVDLVQRQKPAPVAENSKPVFLTRGVPAASPNLPEVVRRPRKPLPINQTLTIQKKTEDTKPIPVTSADEEPRAVLVSGPQPVLELPGGYAAATGSTPASEVGAVTGRVVLNSTPPPEKTLDTDPFCGKGRSAPLKTRSFEVGADKGLANALVFLRDGSKAARLLALTNTVTIQFTNCEIQPYQCAVMTGQGIIFKEGDGRDHVFRTSPLNNKPVSRSLQKNASSSRIGLTSPELFVPIRCAIHSWETAYVSVFDHPYFAITDGDGRFDIPDVPPGKYTLEVVHQKATGTNGVMRALAVRAGEKSAVNFALEVPGNGARLAERADQSR